MCVQVVEMMVTLYSECHLVHADLSEYNILWWQKEAWFIDVSQAVEPIHPSGLDFLLRDCANIYNFFSKKGLHVSHSDFQRSTFTVSRKWTK